MDCGHFTEAVFAGELQVNLPTAAICEQPIPVRRVTVPIEISHPSVKTTDGIETIEEH